jgi:transposase
MDDRTLTYVGLDVSKLSISVAIWPPDGGPCREDRIANTPQAVRRLVRRWPDPDTVRVCYEAGPTGYELHRQLTALGVATTVIAPSLTPRRPGARVKTDRRDARKLAGLFRAGELTAIRVPSPAEEAARDLVRARQDLTEDILRARHRLGKFLLRHGRVYSAGTAWTTRHAGWLATQSFAEPAAQLTLDQYRSTLELRLAQRTLLDAHLAELAASPPFRDGVGRLATLRGINTLAALTLLTEVGDFARFGRAPEFMAFVGLVPSESSSGAHRWQGPITKTGNGHVRRILIQAAWHAHRRLRPGTILAHRRAGQPAPVVTIALRAEARLHDRYWRLVSRGKPPTVAVTAVARELAGFCWAVMRV